MAINYVCQNVTFVQYSIVYMITCIQQNKNWIYGMGSFLQFIVSRQSPKHPTTPLAPVEVQLYKHTPKAGSKGTSLITCGEVQLN